MIISSASRASSAAEPNDVDVAPPPPPPAPPEPRPLVNLDQSSFEQPVTCMGPQVQPITCAGPEKPVTQPITCAGPEKPAAEVKTRIEQTGLAVPQAEKVNTLVQALPADAGAELKALVDKGVTPASIDAAYQQVLAARGQPGTHQLDLSLVPVETRTTYGESGCTSTVECEPRSFGAKVAVGADGTVNGKTLDVDRLARLGSELATVPPEVKEQVLREAGLSPQWLSVAGPGERDYALAKLRDASATPGAKELDLGFSYQHTEGGDAQFTEQRFMPATVKFEVGADGKINGQPPAVEVALATQQAMERMPMEDRRALLAQTGFPPDACAKIHPDEAASILTRVSFATREPGEHSMYVKVDGESWMLGLKIGEKGTIDAAGAQKLPPEPPFWKQVAGPVLSMVGFAFPALLPLTTALNGALALSNGAKGLGLVAAVASMAGGVGSMAGTLAGSASLSSFGSMMTTAGSALNSANGVIQGVRDGNLLAGLSSAVSLAGSVGQLTGTQLGPSFDVLKVAGSAAGVVDRALQGDLAGVFTGAIGLGLDVKKLSGPDEVGATLGAKSKLVGGVKPSDINANIIDARGANLGTAGTTPLASGGLDFSGTVNAAKIGLDYKQDNTGNCTMLSLMQASALWQPGALDERITVSGNTAIVQLTAVDGKPVVVLVDATSPSTEGVKPLSPMPGTDGASATKAYLMQQAVIAALPQLMRSDDPKYAPEWASAEKGFLPTTMMQILTGKPTDWVASSVTSSQKMYDSIVQGTIDGRLMISATSPATGSAATTYANAGLVPSHAYTVVGAYLDEQGQQMVRLINPWRYGEPGAGTSTPLANAADGVNDGIFSMKLNDFMKYFQGMSITQKK